MRVVVGIGCSRKQLDDMWPGKNRGDLLRYVLRDTGICVDEGGTICKFFGDHVYELELADEQWPWFQKEVDGELAALYKRGAIRWGLVCTADEWHTENKPFTESHDDKTPN